MQLLQSFVSSKALGDVARARSAPSRAAGETDAAGVPGAGHCGLWLAHLRGAAGPAPPRRPEARAGICSLRSARVVYLYDFRLLLSCTLAGCSAAPGVSAGAAGSSRFAHVHRRRRASCRLPERTNSPQPSPGQLSSCCRNPPPPPFTGGRLIRKGSRVAVKPGVVVNPGYSSLRKPPASIS